MKLKSVMNEYLDRKQKSSLFLQETLGNLEDPREFPCKVNNNSQWVNTDGISSKKFKFTLRESLRSFCEYILDLEGSHGVQVAMSTLANENHVTIEVSNHLLGSDHFKFFFLEIDNIYLDVVESLENE